MNALSTSIKENDFKKSLCLWPVLLGLYKTRGSLAVKADAMRFRIMKPQLKVQWRHDLISGVPIILFVLQVPATYFNKISEAIQSKNVPCTA